MGDYRSNTYADGRMQMVSYYGNRPTTTDPHGFRSYSASYGSSVAPPPITQMGGGAKDLKLKKGKSTSGSSSKSWNFNDPEFQRKKRVASYKAYALEGKVKGSFRKSFRWLKDRYTQVLYGWR
ncbi:uncharacterized protein LOC132303677 [Cornus florida]|uniref:uncharacterized protein LOC132303677 n=1 Tax=Cornus florida TaxID=4283 RepID=UPI0028973B46|nr:uncharacterized protein LOC132303677 [Cornus florida]